MGLFAAPPKFQNSSAEEFVATAITNLKLWQENGSSREQDYLITMAIADLNNAMRKLRF